MNHGSSLTRKLWLLTFALVFVHVMNLPARAQEQKETEKSCEIPGWFRVDTDGLGTQLWFGATHMVGGLDIASDVYLVSTFGEFDIGLSFAIGPVSLLPMAGIVFDYGTTNISTIVAPQLFTIIDLSDSGIYFESWVQVFLNSPFDEAGEDSIYTRDFLLYAVNGMLSVGPQVELTAGLGDESGIASLAVGGRINLGYGVENTLGLFIGYKTKKVEDTDGITGRMTFIPTFRT